MKEKHWERLQEGNQSQNTLFSKALYKKLRENLWIRKFLVEMEKEITHAFAIKTSVHDYFVFMDFLT